MTSKQDEDKENEQQPSSSGKDNWPQVEIRVAGNPSGTALNVQSKQIETCR